MLKRLFDRDNGVAKSTQVRYWRSRLAFSLHRTAARGVQRLIEAHKLSQLKVLDGNGFGKGTLFDPPSSVVLGGSRVR